MAERDAERTREAILAAAEELFARDGFEGTTMQAIGEAARFARSTPAYFFGSKERLYEAVLARVVGRAREAMARAYATEARSPEDAVAAYVEALVDHLARDSAFVRLVQREALGDGSRVSEFFGEPVRDAVAAVGPAAELAGIRPERLVLDMIALCWVPIVHEHTLLPALGIEARDPAFLEEQKRHVANLVRALTREAASPTGA